MSKTHFLLRSLLLLLFLSLMQQANASVLFHKNLWPHWQINNPLSKAMIIHEDWQNFLTRHVVSNEEGINLIDYTNFNEKDYALLNNYIAKMAQINIDNYNRDEQLAFWLNLYNALTVKIVADYYPVGSIEEINISPGLFSIGPWGAKVVTINGFGLSLDDIYHRILRPIWNDPRVHYAINNASIGAANLSKKAYQGTTINTQLNEAAKQYINSLRGVEVIEGKLAVSKIYDWFDEDFGGTKQDIINHLKLFAQESLRNQLKRVDAIESYIYNWHLNGTYQEYKKKQ